MRALRKQVPAVRRPPDIQDPRLRGNSKLASEALHASAAKVTREFGEPGLDRHQNWNRSEPCIERAPPVCRIGARPLPGLPEPNIRFSIEVELPNTGLFKYFTGSAKFGWLSRLKDSKRNCSRRLSLRR